MAKLTVADLEVLFTANTDQVDKAEKQIVAVGKKVESNPIELDANAKPALEGMDRVEKQAKKLVSERAVVKLDADVARAEKNLGRAIDRLEDLHIRAEGGIDVTADVKRAEASIQRFERQLDGLKRARNVIDVEADTASAEEALDNVESDAAEAGEDSGDAFGKNIVAALATIPIAGAVIGIGVAAGKALIDGFNDGLAVEKRTDRLQALTGVDELAAIRLGAAAGEAYANNFGESIESNMDATRLALQFDILDPTATTRDAQLVVQGLTGIADVLDEDVRPIAQAVTTLLSTGMAKNATQAYDLIAAGARNGLNRNEDLVDTLTEYPVLFKRLGLTGEEALGLINQGMKAGARNSDLAADALKEFQIRATDASESSAEGFRTLGMDAEEMTAKIARGGQDARDGLAEVLTGLREMEDPVARNVAAVALFGTQAEDLGDALFAMDLSSAVDQLDGVTGSAQRMFDTIAGNDASKIEQAQRNIEVAADGIKGALAAAFADPLGDFAEWVSQNRGPVTQFLMDLANGAIDFGIAMVNSGADATEAIGTFVSGPLAFLTAGIAQVMDAMGKDGSKVGALSQQMQDFGEDASKSADVMRTEWVTALENSRDELNKWGDPIVQLGYVNDAAIRTADSVSQVGTAAATGAALLSDFNVAQDGTVSASGELNAQLEGSAAALRDEYEAAIEAGESQQNLQDRYASTRDALIAQVEAMGLTTEQAQALVDTVLQTPEEAETFFKSNADEEKVKVEDLTNRIVTLPDGETTVRAVTEDAMAKLQELKDRLASIPGFRSVTLETITIGNRTASFEAQGGVVEFMAQGGLRGMTPMAPVAQNVPPNTWRVVGDRSDVAEAYIPLDGSARSMSILFEAMRRMGVMPMADGGVVSPAGGRAAGSVFRFGDIIVPEPNLTPAELQVSIERGVRAVINQMFGQGGL